MKGGEGGKRAAVRVVQAGRVAGRTRSFGKGGRKLTVGWWYAPGPRDAGFSAEYSRNSAFLRFSQKKSLGGSGERGAPRRLRGGGRGVRGTWKNKNAFIHPIFQALVPSTREGAATRGRGSSLFFFISS